MNRLKKYFLLCCIALPAAFVCKAQHTDTLAEVKLRSEKKSASAVSVTPVQQLNKEALQQLNSLSVADALKHFAGVFIKDYGGIGGLKTVSVRSLGADHTGLLYNGIVYADVQGGQADLGKFSLDNVEEVVLYNSHPSDILQTARAYASATVLSVKTIPSARFQKDISTFSLQMKAGSFGLVNPSVSFKTAGKKMQTGINAECMNAEGNFRYRSYDGSFQQRNNTDIRTERIEYHAVYLRNDSNRVQLLTDYYNSRRGLPGSVVFYNPAPATQRLDDEVYFTQLSWQNYLSLRSRLLVSAKFSVSNTYYTDPSYPNSFGKLENFFHNKEKYISAAYSYRFTGPFSVCLSADFFNNRLKRTDRIAGSFANPDRDNFLANIAANLKKDRFEIAGNLLYTTISETAQKGNAGRDFSELTPAISASFLPAKNFPLRIRAFYKNIFRAPTFNDLYYTNIGNTNLRPEYVKQYNAGLTYQKLSGGLLNEIVITADGYINTITDRILAVPRQNLFQWTILNIGKVNIKGIDVSTGLGFNAGKEIKLSSKIAYTFQKALDISDPSSPVYRTQLPYTPEHSAAINLNAVFRKMTFSYNIISSSYRYRSGEQIPENVVQGWSQHDLTLQYRLLNAEKEQLLLHLAVNNIYNTQYDVIKFYPMPRLSCRIGITATFKHQHKTKEI